MEDGLDGPERKKWRTKLAWRSKIGFADREQSQEGAGHVLWQGSAKVEGWGVVSVADILPQAIAPEGKPKLSKDLEEIKGDITEEMDVNS
jgi:hypothetical protein